MAQQSWQNVVDLSITAQKDVATLEANNASAHAVCTGGKSLNCKKLQDLSLSAQVCTTSVENEILTVLDG